MRRGGEGLVFEKGRERKAMLCFCPFSLSSLPCSLALPLSLALLLSLSSCFFSLALSLCSSVAAPTLYVCTSLSVQTPTMRCVLGKSFLPCSIAFQWPE